jgi:indolepyruvate ferredoxin oxidoreductase beta subunit
MQLADGSVDDGKLLSTLRANARDTEVFDMAALAREAGTVISAVMLGAVAATGLLPFARAAY